MIQLKRQHAVLAVVLAALAVYANSLWNGFAYDDIWIIKENTRVHQLGDLSAIWLTPYWPSFGAQLGLYRPFAIFAYAIQWAISDGAPWFFHLVNVVLHAGVSVLVLLLFDKLFNLRVAFATALVFAIHPVHTEAVANVVGQNELWAAVGALGACIVYVSRPEGPGISARRLAGVIALYLLSLLSKESAAGLPALLVLLDFVQRRVELDRAALVRYVRALLPMAATFAALMAVYLVVRHNVLGTFGGTDAAPGLPHLSEQYRVLNALRAWPEFVRLMFFPLDLSVDYSPGVVLPVESFTPMVMLGALLVTAVVLLTFMTPRAPRPGLVAGWFLITILPVSNFFFPIGVLIAERTLYLPSIAFCLFVGFAWEAVTQTRERETRLVGRIAAFALVSFFSVRTVIRNPDWDSLLTVWNSLTRDHPESYRAQWLVASNMWSKGRFDLADRYFEIAYRIWPRDSQMISEWGNFHIGRRNWNRAIELLEMSRDMTPFVPRTHTFLAWSYLFAGRNADALASAEHALTLEGPDRSILYPVIARANEELGNYDKAVAAWTQTVQLKRGDLWLNWAMRARAEASAGLKDRALATADVALQKTKGEPRSSDAVRKLKGAITGGCYPAGGACDPLEGWQIAVGSPSADPGPQR